MANAILAPTPGQNQAQNIQRYQSLIPLLKFVTVAVLLLTQPLMCCTDSHRE